ncbi:MAG: hypothetical protein ABGZ53_08250, partial [Fuerstiella sp.]
LARPCDRRSARVPVADDTATPLYAILAITVSSQVFGIRKPRPQALACWAPMQCQSRRLGLWRQSFRHTVATGFGVAHRLAGPESQQRIVPQTLQRQTQQIGGGRSNWSVYFLLSDPLQGANRHAWSTIIRAKTPIKRLYRSTHADRAKFIACSRTSSTLDQPAA